MRRFSGWFEAPEAGDFWQPAAVLAVCAVCLIILEVRERWRNPVLIQARCVRVVGPLFEGDPEPSPSEMPRWLIQLRLSNRGRRQIDRSAFEDGTLALSIGDFALLTGALQFDRVPINAYRKERRIELIPKALPRGTVWRWAINAVGDEPAISLVAKPSKLGVRLRVYPPKVRGTAVLFAPFGFARRPRWRQWIRFRP